MKKLSLRQLRVKSFITTGAPIGGGIEATGDLCSNLELCKTDYFCPSDVICPSDPVDCGTDLKKGCNPF